MHKVSPARRAALLGVALVALGCDLATFVSDPLPRFEQTWNLPATSNRISVADLLPSGNTVSIKQPDSSAFLLTVQAASISRVVGNDCTACLPLNGTNAIKPAFTLVANNSTSLPTDVVSAAVVNGKVTVALTNSMSFDPIQVKTGPGAQGYMVIVIRSGTVVLGRDSVDGATTAWPAAPAAGSLLTRIIRFNSGTVTGSLTADITVFSPVGDHLEPINANGLLNASAAIDSLEVASVALNVPNQTMNSGAADTVDLEAIDSTFAIKSAGLEMTFVNPFAVTGNLTVLFRYGTGANDTAYTSIALPQGTGQRTALFTEAQIKRMTGKKNTLSVTGSVTSTGAIIVTPKQEVKIDNRLVVKVQVPSGGN